MEKEKTCFKCGDLKPISDYYKHKGMSDGHLNKCKLCTRKDSQDRLAINKQNPEWVAKEMLRVRNKQAELAETPIGRIKLQARNAARFTTSTEEAKHHWSYKPEHHKDIIGMTVKDHYKIHRYIKFDEFHLQFRTLRGILMDTKDVAEIEYERILRDEED